MMFQKSLLQKAEKDLKKVDNFYKSKIELAIDEIIINPYEGKKLKGKLADFYSKRVGSYRIIYRIFESEKIIVIVRIGLRQGVYNN